MNLWPTPTECPGAWPQPPKATSGDPAHQPLEPSRAARRRPPQGAAISRLAHKYAMLALTMALVGCGTSAPSVASDTGWNGRSTVIDASSGSVEFPGLNKYIEDHQPFWANDARKVAATALRLGPSQEPQRIRMRVRDSRRGSPMVQVTFSGLLDDSTAAVRYDIRLRQGSDGLYRVDETIRTSRCRWGRGPGLFPGGFTTGSCA